MKNGFNILEYKNNNSKEENRKRRKGITLAEVLIAATIIGVTAKLLVPSIYWSIKKLKLTSRYTKSYSEMSQCIKTAERRESNFSSWIWADDEQVFRQYFKPYLRLRKICGKGANADCGSNTEYKYLNGSKASNPFSNSYYRFITDDGARWAIQINADYAANKQYCAMLRVDLNGEEKPNTYGRDVFTFYMLPITNEFLTEGLFNPATGTYNAVSGWAKASYSEINSNCDGKTGTGTYCGARIVKDGYSMDY